jgi:hypothetical protein
LINKLKEFQNLRTNNLYLTLKNVISLGNFYILPCMIF